MITSIRHTYESVEDSHLHVIQKTDMIGWKFLSVVRLCLTKGILVTRIPYRCNRSTATEQYPSSALLLNTTKILNQFSIKSINERFASTSPLIPWIPTRSYSMVEQGRVDFFGNDGLFLNYHDGGGLNLRHSHVINLLSNNHHVDKQKVTGITLSGWEGNGITEDSSLVFITDNFPQLEEELSVKSSDLITDNGIIAVTKKCHKLTNLNYSRYSKVTNAASSRGHCIQPSTIGGTPPMPMVATSLSSLMTLETTNSNI